MRQVSAGGVAYRVRAGVVRVALISVATPPRWQLPKGFVEAGERAEEAAIREVREEAGLECELVAPLETIRFWFFATEQGERVRIHKLVHFFLLRAVRGSVTRHDREVHEARWMPIDAAIAMLAFENERRVVRRAATIIGDVRGVGG